MHAYIVDAYARMYTHDMLVYQIMQNWDVKFAGSDMALSV